MGKKIIQLYYLLSFLLMVLSIDSISQSFTQHIEWISPDSIVEMVLVDTNQIIDWGINIDAPSVAYVTEYYLINGQEVFILGVDICSGIYCPFIYIFIKKKNLWNLVTGAHIILNERLIIKKENDLKKIVLKTNSREIGELPFDIFEQYSD